jgi:hypothetical protein
MIADSHARNARPDRLDHSRSFVPEHGGTGCLRGPVDRVVVGVADPARTELHEHLLRRGRRELELRDGQRPSGPLEDDATDLHADTLSFPWSARSSSIGM